MAGRSVFIVITVIVFTGIDCKITNSPPPDQTVCVGDNVKLEWTYDDASNFLTVTWKHTNTSSAEETIMQHVNGLGAPTKLRDNVEFIGNGEITLINVSLSDSGSYQISVTYSSSSLPDDSTVNVNVKVCGGGNGGHGTEPPGPCPWWCILIIVIVCLYLCGTGIGIFMFCCKDEPCNKIYVGDRIPCWVFPLIIIIVGLGILTVFAICYFGDWFGCCACCVECCCGCCDDCCGSSNDDSTQNEMPMKTKK